MAKEKIAKESDINITIGLNEAKVPVKITWQNDENPKGTGKRECKAILLSLFDKESLATMKVDLWTTDMQVAEMDQFFYETLSIMSDTYLRSTKNQKLASEMRQFVQYFGEQTKIIKKANT